MHRTLYRLMTVAALAGTALVVPTAAHAVTCTTTPRLAGSFIQPALADGWTNTQLANEYTYLTNACMTTQVIQWTADSKHHTATYSTGLSGYTKSTATEVPDRILSKAETAGVNVYVGLQINDDWWTNYADNATWLANEATLAENLADELWSNYGPYDSFAGWYLPFEADNLHFQTTAQQDALAGFYADVIGHLHTLSPGLPVVTSPFYNANLTGTLDPTGWQSMWTRILGTAPIDAIALQDGVGAGHATSTQLASWFSATKNAITAARPATLLYDDVETFVLGASGFQPMPIKDVVTDMAAVSSYVSGYWAFSYDHYQSPLAPYSTYYDATYRNYLTNGVVETTVPGTPTSLAATATNSQTVSLTWTAPTDNIGVAGYNIYRGGDLVATKHGSATGFTDQQLDGSTAYSYTVKAFDGAGNLSAAATTANVTTPAAPVYSTNWAAGKTYTSSIAANASYPDTGGVELTDGVKATGPFYGAPWQGRNAVGSYTFVIDLGTSRTINSLTSSWLQVRPDYVFLPTSVKYEVSATGSSYTTAGTVTLPAVNSVNQIKNYKLISLSLTGRYVRVTVDGGSAWSMLDEIEVRAV
ncbi:MAG: DUF4434 domain-containing protein [Hamadaea sp.]|uniref:DUF4434 domain-containing protein n=1 Tax=Hamadaea sp. TaxID=2024425 RepID=UPI001818C70A|nr:DUF4434 domain-containing protein [Hamadaea sp.]NUT20590.1 DUF4434 domain-containing protein [Hamadaea sp.]